jgi:hypothetical protein
MYDRWCTSHPYVHIYAAAAAAVLIPRQLCNAMQFTFAANEPTYKCDFRNFNDFVLKKIINVINSYPTGVLISYT